MLTKSSRLFLPLLNRLWINSITYIIQMIIKKRYIYIYIYTYIIELLHIVLRLCSEFALAKTLNVFPVNFERTATIYCSRLFLNPAHAANDSCDWLNLRRCRHRSECPFIPAFGRWTLHLINNEGNFSILQPVYSDTATYLGFYYFSSLVRFPLSLWESPWRKLDFALPFLSELFFVQAERRENISVGLCISTKRLVGLCSLFGSVGFSLLEREAWERNCPRHLKRLKPWLKSPEKLLHHPPRPTDR